MIETSMITAVIMALSEVVKAIGLNVKFVPLLNLILGIGLNLLVRASGNTAMDIFNGIVIGLAASGLYSGIKNVAEGITKSGQ